MEGSDFVEGYMFIAIIVLCCIIVGIGIMRHKMEIVVNFILRFVVGIVGIYLLNFIFSSKGIQINVGVNAVTTLAVGFLGIPGFILIYSLCFYFMIRL